MKIQGRSVFVGLSGGVDSAVTAALLQREGARVTGVFIKGWYPEGMPCTWAEDRRDAMRVAARLHIPFLTLDASTEYKKAVIDYLIREYAEGRTPNPDIMCNREVKFGAFYRFAMERGADYIATGHYARINSTEDEKHAASQAVPCEVERSRKLPAPLPHVFHLLRGVDPAKDQSYFLWAIPKETLPHVLFPLGGMRKEEVRELAARFNLPVAKKRDSQGICFLGDVSIEEFLRHEVGLSEGEAYNESGERVGTHTGAIAYTLGERVSLLGSQPGPWYVIKKDIPANSLTVSHILATPPTDQKMEITLSDINWLTEVQEGESYTAQYRYHGPKVRGKLVGNHFVPEHVLTEPLAPGQSLVFYKDDELIGGGIIA